MSADRWTKCPKCAAKEAAEVEKMERALEKAYGTVTTDEFLKRVTVIEARRNRLPEDSMREDREIGVDHGEFTVDFRCHCQACGFAWRYQYSCDPTATPSIG